MKIVADFRERVSGIPDALHTHKDIEIEVKKLVRGDYVVNDRITIERKTARDFVVSIVDGRLFAQIARLKRHAHCPLLLVEGNPYRAELGVERNAIKGAIVSIQAIWQVPLLFSRSSEDTVDTLIMIGRQDTQSHDAVLSRGGRRPKRLSSRQLYLLQGLPHVGPTLAKRLIDRFGSVVYALNASIDDLTDIEGIGAIKAAKIRELLDVNLSGAS